MRLTKTSTTLLILGGCALGFIVAYLSLFAPANYRSDQYLFTIESGQSISDITKSLAENKFLRSELGGKIAFRLSATGIVRAGTYNISPRMNAWQIATQVKKGETAGAKVTIPEGYTVSQIYDRLTSLQVATTRGLEDASNKLDLGKYPFIKPNQQVNNPLEGYLFPDTYNFNRGMPEDSILIRMLDNFASRTRDLLPKSAEVGLTPEQLITLASLVEKEARTEEDRKLIAGVLLNRIKNNMRLDVDATVRFITNNWTKPITSADLEINSPYNTRLKSGLPPGPICNPGLAAIQAVVSPTPSDYLYYLTDDQGVTHYAQTLDEHNLNKAKYLQ